MEPRIQYAPTKDGIRIAYFTLGEGMPSLVMMPGGPFISMDLDWQIPENRDFLESLAAERMLIQYNQRGCGISEGDMADLSLEVVALDLEAVADRLHLDRFALFAPVMAGPGAATYAAQNPDRVSHLIFMNTAARGTDFIGSPRDRALGQLMEADWELYTETLAHVAYGWSASDAARQAAVRYREVATPDTTRLAFRAIAHMDSTALLPQVRCPTLVLHRRQISFARVEAARALASNIPDARLTLVEGTSVAPWMGDTAAVVGAINEFLGADEEAAASRSPSGVATILFTDMEGSTTLTQRLGDAKAQEVLRTHNGIIRDSLKAHSGSETKHTGDGIMASFASASKALEAAMSMQRAFAQHNDSNPDIPIRVRIGLNAGEPVAEDADLFGTAVQLAARICAHAQPGQILIPEGVRHLVAGKKFLFADLGETVLRGFEDPVRLYELRWQGEE